MDISDEICRPDFFDLVPMGLDPKFGDPATHGLMPVTLIDSSEYMQPDGNNNMGSTTGHIKSFLDEMFLVDPMTGGEPGQSIATLNSASFEVLGTFQWSGENASGGDGVVGSNTIGSSEMDENPGSDAHNWFLNPNFNSDGEVTTLTNLIDPLFVTYGDEHVSNGDGSVGGEADNGILADGNAIIKIEPPEVDHQAVSSDLISSTFLNESAGDSTTEVVVSQSTSDSDLIPWHKSSNAMISSGSTTTNLFCDESLLRSALQSGKTGHGIVNGTKIVKLAVVASSVPATNDMTELRTLLSFPPLTSPTSSTPENPNQISTDNSAPAYYELKVIDPMFSDDANIPNVEELIMTRIDPPFGIYQQQQHDNERSKAIKRKLGEISERKINSTTLSTKWTYTTTPNHQQGKAPRRRNKKNNNNNNNNNDVSNNAPKKTLDGISLAENGILNGNGPFSPSNKTSSSNDVGSPGSQQSNGTGSSNSNSSNGNGIRKERSLHYCNICCKGFKDKYSVNVHVRTHTGEKPFSCNLCGKNFRQKAHLAKHYQTHAAKANNQQNKANNAAINNNTSNSNSSSNNNNDSSKR